MLALTGTGCVSVEPEPRLPKPVAELPALYSGPDDEDAYSPLQWWQAFDDPTLNRLVDSALVANLDLVEAAARVEEVRARHRLARSALVPSITTAREVTYSDIPGNTGQLAAFSRAGVDSTGAGGNGATGDGAADDDTANDGTDRFEITTYSAALNFAYELDFWGRTRNDALAALREAFATHADVHTVRLGVLGETIAGYFEIVDLRAQIAILVETIGVLSERVERAEARYDRGLVSSFELYQIRQDYRSTQASLPQLESQLTGAESRLAVLLGRYPGQVVPLLSGTLAPQLVFDPVPTGLPADLLIQRPDVRAAAYRLEAARARIGARRAERFPSLSLSGSVGTESDDPEGVFDIFNQWTLGLGASLTAPLFQGGRIRADIDVAEAQYTQAAAAYARTVLTAFQEVVAAMEDYQEERQRYAFFRAQLEEAEATVDVQADRYRAGLTAYTDYLDAVRALYQVQISLSSAGREAALALLAVHRALGGGWTDEDVLPLLDLVPAEVPLGRDAGVASATQPESADQGER